MFSATDSMAFTTVATSLFVAVSVLVAIWVSMRAMSFGKMPFSQRLADWPSQDVHTHRNWLQVSDRHATPMGAASILHMVDGQPFGDRANYMFITPTVSLNGFAVEPKASVSVGIEVPYPEDFAVATTRINFRPEALKRSYPSVVLTWLDGKFPAAKLLVMRIADAAPLDGLLAAFNRAGVISNIRAHLEPPIPGVTGRAVSAAPPSYCTPFASYSGRKDS